MKANIGFNEDGYKVRLEIGNNDFLEFMNDLELVHRIASGTKTDVETYINNLKSGEYDGLGDVARNKLIEDKEYELKAINRALDNIEEIVVLSNEL